MSLLIIHCPFKPFHQMASSEGGFNAQKELFEWCLAETNSLNAQFQSSGTGSIESMPFADEVIALIPTLDVRLLEKKVPLVSAKKLEQVLPSLIEDDVLGGLENSLAYALPPLPGQAGSQRTIAIINRSWFDWLTKEFEPILTSRIRMIPDCFILPLENDSIATREAEQSCLALKQTDSLAIYTWHQSEQLGIAWVEYRQDASLPSRLQHLKTLSWSWEWMLGNTFTYSRRTDLAVSSLNLLLASPNARKLKKKQSLAWLKDSSNPLAHSSGSIASWLDYRLWIKPTRWAVYASCSMFLGLGFYTSWLAIDNWRWGRNMDISAAQFLAPETAKLLAQSKTNTSIAQALTIQVSQEARNKGLPTDADFIAMTGKLAQLKTALGKGSIDKMEYDGYRIDFEFKPGGEVLTATDVIGKAQSLGLMVADLGNNRYRLQPFAGLGAN